MFFILYFFSAKGYVEVSDTAFSIQTAEAIVTRDKLDIPFQEMGTLKGTDGLSYSKYGIGLALYYVPIVALGHVLSWLTGFPEEHLTGFLISFANIPFALFTLYLFGRCLKQLGISLATANWMVVGLGCGTLCWKYAVYDFSEVMQACLLLLVFTCVLENTKASILVGGMALGGLILVKLVHVVFLPVFLLYLFVLPDITWLQRIRKVALFSVPIGPFILLIAFLNYVRFGSPLESGYGGEASQFHLTQLWWTVPSLLCSLDKGLFIFCPILILEWLGWPAFVRRQPLFATLCITIILVNLLLAGAWHSWVGGWSWGPRLLVPAIPLWLLPAAFWLDSPSGQHKKKIIFTGVLMISVVAQVPGVMIKDQQIHHIKQDVFTPVEREFAAADYPAAWILLWHKMRKPEIYQVSEFGVQGNREMDLSGYPTFQGQNLWTEHVARRFNRPFIRWLPLAGLMAIGFLLFRLERGV